MRKMPDSLVLVYVDYTTGTLLHTLQEMVRPWMFGVFSQVGGLKHRLARVLLSYCT